MSFNPQRILGNRFRYLFSAHLTAIHSRVTFARESRALSTPSPFSRKKLKYFPSFSVTDFICKQIWYAFISGEPLEAIHQRHQMCARVSAKPSLLRMLQKRVPLLAPLHFRDSEAKLKKFHPLDSHSVPLIYNELKITHSLPASTRECSRSLL